MAAVSLEHPHIGPPGMLAWAPLNGIGHPGYQQAPRSFNPSRPPAAVFGGDLGVAHQSMYPRPPPELTGAVGGDRFAMHASPDVSHAAPPGIFSLAQQQQAVAAARMMQPYQQAAHDVMSLYQQQQALAYQQQQAMFLQQQSAAAAAAACAQHQQGMLLYQRDQFGSHSNSHPLDLRSAGGKGVGAPLASDAMNAIFSNLHNNNLSSDIYGPMKGWAAYAAINHHHQQRKVCKILYCKPRSK